jgi:SAM-dependent methyltransferase
MNKTPMKNVNCYYCGDSKSNFYASENGYNLVKCNTFGLLYVNPRPSDNDILQAHKTGQHKGDELLTVTGSFQDSKVKNYKEVLAELFGTEFPIHINSWLDIGCGHGEFLLAIQEFSNTNPILKGLEPNVEKQKSGQKYSLDISDFDLSKHSAKYDVISLLNVYSHLPDPAQSIADLKSYLQPNGMILIETGDGSHFSIEDQIRPFYLPDHLSLASEMHVVNLLKRNGFEISSILKLPLDPSLSMISFAKELIKWFIPSKASRLKYLLNRKKYSQVDMYILARRKT